MILYPRGSPSLASGHLGEMADSTSGLDRKWGIELLREHDRLAEHCKQFQEGGRYHSWIKDGSLEDWIIIDCATSSPLEGILLIVCYTDSFTNMKAGHVDPKVWYAVFHEDYPEFQLLDNKKAPLARPFILAN